MLFRKKPDLAPLTPLFAWARQHAGMSLAWKIAAINMGAMVLAIVGVLYSNQYMETLIRHEMGSMQRQAELVAGTIAGQAVVLAQDVDGQEVIQPEITVQIVRRLVDGSEMRTQVFKPDLEVIADSWLLKGGGVAVRLEPVAAPSDQYGYRVVPDVMRWLAEQVPLSINRPLYPKSGDLSNAQLFDVRRALTGEVSQTVWQSEQGQPVLTLAVPVQRLQKTLGVVLVTRSARDVAESIISLRINLITTFLSFLLVSVLVSLYMAQTVIRPLRRLAQASLQARSVASGPPHIPDYTFRRDEIGDLSAALASMTEALWHRLDATERFAADVSHELKNPITSMRSALETLSKVSDKEKQDRLLHILRDDVSRLDRLISEISALTRIEGEMSRQPPEHFDFVSLVSGYVTSKTQSGLPLVLQVRQSHLPVLGLKSGLVQVLDNLVGNALSFSPADKAVVVRAERIRAQVYLFVEDEGPGIPAGKLERIFERFYSERPPEHRTHVHSGLGLNICKQIVESHGGRIYAENRLADEPGQGKKRVIGARFVVVLPLQTGRAG